MRQSLIWNPLLGKPRYEYRPRLNPEHPLNYKLDCLILANENAGLPHDIARNAPITFNIVAGTPSVSWAQSAWGSYAMWDWQAHLRIEYLRSTSGIVPSSYFWSLNKLATYWGIYFGNAQYPTVESCMPVTDATGAGIKFGWAAESGTNLLAKFVYTPAVGDRIVLTWDGTSNASGVSCYANGVVLAHDSGETGGGTLYGAGFTEHPLKVFEHQNAGFGGFQRWARTLTATEAAELSAHPYGTPSNPRLIVEPRRTWFVPTAGFKPYWARESNQLIGGGYVS